MIEIYTRQVPGQPWYEWHEVDLTIDLGSTSYVRSYRWVYFDPGQGRASKVSEPDTTLREQLDLSCPVSREKFDMMWSLYQVGDLLSDY